MEDSLILVGVLKEPSQQLSPFANNESSCTEFIEDLPRAKLGDCAIDSKAQPALYTENYVLFFFLSSDTVLGVFLAFSCRLLPKGIPPQSASKPESCLYFYFPNRSSKYRSTHPKWNRTLKSPSKLKAPWEFQLKTCAARRETISLLSVFLCRLSSDPTECFGTWAQILYVRYPGRTIPMAFRLYKPTISCTKVAFTYIQIPGLPCCLDSFIAIHICI